MPASLDLNPIKVLWKHIVFFFALLSIVGSGYLAAASSSRFCNFVFIQDALAALNPAEIYRVDWQSLTELSSVVAGVENKWRFVNVFPTPSVIPLLNFKFLESIQKLPIWRDGSSVGALTGPLSGPLAQFLSLPENADGSTLGRRSFILLSLSLQFYIEFVENIEKIIAVQKISVANAARLAMHIELKRILKLVYNVDLPISFQSSINGMVYIASFDEALRSTDMYTYFGRSTALQHKLPLELIKARSLVKKITKALDSN